MKKIICVFLVLFLVNNIHAQSDTSISDRLDNYSRYNRELNFEKVMDYMHPSLFKLAPRNTLIEQFKQMYDSEEMSISIDTMETRKISEGFMLKGAQYKRVDYYMVISMKFKDEKALNDTSFVNLMISSLSQSMPLKKTTFDNLSKNFRISGPDILLAIKDTPQTPWMFLGFDNNNPVTASLFPKEVIQHFKLQ